VWLPERVPYAFPLLHRVWDITDAKTFWLTATVLEQEVSTSVVLLPDAGGHVNVIEVSLEARPK